MADPVFVAVWAACMREAADGGEYLSRLCGSDGCAPKSGRKTVSTVSAQALKKKIRNKAEAAFFIRAPLAPILRIFPVSLL